MLLENAELRLTIELSALWERNSYTRQCNVELSAITDDGDKEKLNGARNGRRDGREYVDYKLGEKFTKEILIEVQVQVQHLYTADKAEEMLVEKAKRHKN